LHFFTQEWWEPNWWEDFVFSPLQKRGLSYTETRKLNVFEALRKLDSFLRIDELEAALNWVDETEGRIYREARAKKEGPDKKLRDPTPGEIVAETKKLKALHYRFENTLEKDKSNYKEIYNWNKKMKSKVYKSKENK